MAELVYAQHSKCCDFGHEGSTPFPSTIGKLVELIDLKYKKGLYALRGVD